MWGGRRRGRPTSVLSLMLGLAVLLSGCVLSTKEDRRRAQELADERYPGLLRAFAARTLFPSSAGSEVSFAVADDPDAVVRLRLDSGTRDCAGAPCPKALDAALADARSAATDLRSLRAALKSCGYELRAVREHRATVAEPWIEARLTNDGFAEVLRELGECLRGWSGLRSGSEPLEGAGAPRSGPPRSLTLNIVAPGTGSTSSAPGPTNPGMVGLSDRRTLSPLLARSRYAVTWPVRDGLLDHSAIAPRLVMPSKERRAYEEAVAEHVGSWLADRLPEAHQPRAHGITRLAPGRVDRLHGYVLFCEGAHDRTVESAAPRGGRVPRCLGQHAVRVTTELDGRLVGEPQVVRDVREGASGPLRLPEL